MTDLLQIGGISTACQQRFSCMQVISYYMHLEEMSTLESACVACCCVYIVCRYVKCAVVCVEKKGRKRKKKEAGGGRGSKWSGSVSVTVNLLNHLPPSNKIEHQAELNNCQTPRHHPNREEISSKKGRGCFSREGR